MIIKKYINFFADPEKEVVKISLMQFRELVDSLGKNFVIEKVLPIFNAIANSEETDLKESLSYSILSVSPLVGKMQSYLNIFLVLLKDKEYRIKIAVMSHMRSVLEVIPLQSLLDTTLPVLNEMHKCHNWKYRMKVAEFVEFFAENDKVNCIQSLLTIQQGARNQLKAVWFDSKSNER